MTRTQETELLTEFDRQWRRLRWLSFRHVSLSHFDWDEIRADCLIRVFRGYATYDPARPLGGWTRVVLRNTAMNGFRRLFGQLEWRRRVERPWRLYWEPVDPATEVSYQPLLDEFRATLTRRDRTIWELRGEGKTFNVIGRRVGWSYWRAYDRMDKLCQLYRDWRRDQ